jgi:malate dehydrogenase
MRSSLLKSTSELLRRSRGYSSSANPERKVAILGAAGGIGQPLALLMKLNPLVSSLSLYDIAGTVGVAADVSHINSPALVCPRCCSARSTRATGSAGSELIGLVYRR